MKNQPPQQHLQQNPQQQQQQHQPYVYVPQPNVVRTTQTWQSPTNRISQVANNNGGNQWNSNSKGINNTTPMQQQQYNNVVQVQAGNTNISIPTDNGRHIRMI
jgi:hypothetical protein